MKNDVNALIQAMRNGKKIRPKDGLLRVCTSVPIVRVTYKDGKENSLDFNEDYFYNKFEIPNHSEVVKVNVVGSSSYKTYEIQYIYFNSQCNMCLAKLANGDTTDYPLNLTRFLYDEFEIVEDKDLVRKVTLDEVYAKFGYKVEIV
jgi:hypothetical protein